MKKTIITKAQMGKVHPLIPNIMSNSPLVNSPGENFYEAQPCWVFQLRLLLVLPRPPR